MGRPSHHSPGRKPEQTKSVRQNKSRIPSGLEKSFGVIGGLLQVDRHPHRVQALVEIHGEVFSFFGIQLGGGNRRGFVKKRANIGVSAAGRNCCTSRADRMRFVHYGQFTPGFKAAQKCTPPTRYSASAEPLNSL